MATYNDLRKELGESYSLNYLKKMETASSIDETFKWFNSILSSRPSYVVYFWKDTYIPVLYKVINANILRLFKENVNPSEDNLVKSIVNLRGDYNETAENIIKEAAIKKSIANASVCAQEVLSIKKKYDNAWLQLRKHPDTTVEHQMSKIEISSLLKPMKRYGYIHTRKERESISDYGLNKTENVLKIVFIIIVGCLFGLLIVWAGNLLVLFGLFIGAMLLKCMR